MDGANKGFKLLMRDLENDYVPGLKYPVMLAEALQVLMVYSEQPVVYKAIMKKLKTPVSRNRRRRS
jgi:hypothetical protein